MADINQPIVPVRRATVGMSGFIEKRAPLGITGRIAAPRVLKNAAVLEFIKCSPDLNDAAHLIYTCLIECNKHTTEHYQACCFYLSALSILFPDLEEVSKNTLRRLGFTTQDVTQGELATLGIPYFEIDDSNKVLVMIGQVLFLLYKNISEASYERFMRNRTNALKAMAGLDGPLMTAEGGDAAVVGIVRAESIRRTLGAQYELRKAVLETMLAHQSNGTSTGDILAYVCGMLSWNEMSSILFIYQTLCQTKSPVLRDMAVRDEVKGLYIAARLILAQPMPQYFRILNPYSETRVIEKSKFPVLAAVAQNIRAEGFASVGQFAQPLGTNTALVERLVHIHKTHINRTQIPLDSHLIQFLYNTDEMDEPEQGQADD